MRSRRVLAALLLTPSIVVPVSSSTERPEERETLALAARVERSEDARATRSGTRTAVVPTETTTPTPSTTTTTTRPTTTTTSTTAEPAPKAVVPAPGAKKATGTTESVAPAAGVNHRAAQVARAQVGKAYRFGATGPNAFDCSGLIFYAFKQSGVNVPRLTSDGYYAKYPKVSRSDLQPGDLVVSPGHIGIYIGNGQIVHASTPRGGVKIAPVGVAGPPFGYVRIS